MVCVKIQNKVNRDSFYAKVSLVNGDNYEDNLILNVQMNSLNRKISSRIQGSQVMVILVTNKRNNNADRMNVTRKGEVICNT